MSETKVKIFISYSHADRALCETIADALGKAEGLSVWYDKELLAGEVYRNRIVEKIETADVFIVLLSQNSIKSKWVKKELEYAEEKLFFKDSFSGTKLFLSVNFPRWRGLSEGEGYEPFPENYDAWAK